MEMQLILGTQASCSDGACGQLQRIILDPAERKVTHLAIEAGHSGAVGRLVPVSLVEQTSGELKLSCTTAQFDQLDLADNVELAEGTNYAGHIGRGAVLGVTDAAPEESGASPTTDMGLGRQTPIVTTDAVPEGESEEDRHERVHAVDGRIGKLKGFAVDQADHRVTQVLLREGHLWGSKQVAIPISAVASLEDGVQLNVTKKQVEDLPAAR
jgi:sporulation protein YlmC with PRC-barrel domain